MKPLLPAVAKQRNDGSVFMSFGDPAKGAHEQFDFHGSFELSQAIADAYTSCHLPADLEPISDDSLQAQVGEVGNQIHNISCEHQNNEELSARLSDAACKLWKLSRAVGTPPPPKKVGEDDDTIIVWYGTNGAEWRRKDGRRPKEFGMERPREYRPVGAEVNP